MAIFLTGATGYLGAYLVRELLARTGEPLALLVRGEDEARAAERLWGALQPHLSLEAFRGALRERVTIFTGDCAQPQLGLPPERYRVLVQLTQSVIHCAAAVNRRSWKAGMNGNLRATLEVIKLVKAAQAAHGVRRLTVISTTTVAGPRQDETIDEEAALRWDQEDVDPYAFTKKFAEHMARELLPDVPVLTLRPSSVIGDSVSARTTQFQMLQGLAMLQRLPLIPHVPTRRLDIVPADWVAAAVVQLHQKPSLRHATYHLSAGEASPTYAELARALRGGRPGRFAPWLGTLYAAALRLVGALPRRLGVARAALLFRVFWPYLTCNTVFDNRRVLEELGVPPPPFLSYGASLLTYAQAQRYRYTPAPLPADAREAAPVPSLAAASPAD